MPPLIRVWDWPVRLTHWLFVVLFLISWVTAEQAWLEVHRVSGYTMLALVLFRIYWGFFGSDTAQFRHFLRGPTKVLRYARSLASPPVGHTPLGGWSVMILLSALLFQTVLGLFAVDVDGIVSGPLASYVTFETGRRAAEWHEFVFDVLLLLVALHVTAILTYLLVKQENLILPMVTGVKETRSAQPPPLYFASSRRAWLGLALAALLVLILAISGERT